MVVKKELKQAPLNELDLFLALVPLIVYMSVFMILGDCHNISHRSAVSMLHVIHL